MHRHLPLRVAVGTCVALAAVVAVFGAPSALAVDSSSANYRIEGGVVGGFGGDSSSTGYSLSASAGEAFVGSGSSTSYRFDAGYVARLERSISLSANASSVSLSPAPSQASDTTTTTLSVLTDGGGFQLGVSQNQPLTSGGNTIPPVGGSIATPAAWSEGVTTGLGFTITAGTGVDPKWSSKYAAFPASDTTFHVKNGYQATWNDTTVQYRLAVTSSQPAGAYTNQITYTALALP